MSDQKNNAANIGDIIKHSLLCALVSRFNSQHLEGWEYLETHAGYLDYSRKDLQNENGDWHSDRKWSIGVLEHADEEALKVLGGFGELIKKQLFGRGNEGKYPGSIKQAALICDENTGLKKIRGFDKEQDPVETYDSFNDERVAVKKVGDGFNAVGKRLRVRDSEKEVLIFCDPFFNDEKAAVPVKQLVEEGENVIVWYPLIKKTDEFRKWIRAQEWPFFEMSYLHKDQEGWFSRDLRGAGLLIKGLGRDCFEDAKKIAKNLQAIFRGKEISGRKLDLSLNFFDPLEI